MLTVVVNGFRASPVTTDSTDIPVILVHVIPIEAHRMAAFEELFPNDRVRGSSSLHGSVATLGIHRTYVGVYVKEVVKGIHVLGPRTRFQLRLA